MTTELIDLHDVAAWVMRTVVKKRQNQTLTTQIDAQRRIMKLCVGTPSSDNAPHPHVYVVEGRDLVRNEPLPYFDILYVDQAIGSYERLMMSTADNRLKHTTIHRLMSIAKVDSLQMTLSEDIYNHLIKQPLRKAA